MRLLRWFPLIAIASVSTGEGSGLASATQPAPFCRAPAPAAGFATRDSAGLRIVENWSPGGGAVLRIAARPGVAIGSDNQGSYPYQLTRVNSATRLSDGSIVIAEGQVMEIRIFGPDGRHVRTLGRKGQGPGEYTNLARVVRLEGDTLLAVDPGGRKITFLLPDGRIIRTVGTPSVAFTLPSSAPNERPIRGSSFVQVLGRQADGSYLGTHNVMRRGEDRTQVIRARRNINRVSATGATADSVAAYLGQEHMTFSTPDGYITFFDVPWGVRGSLAQNTAGFITSNGDRFEVHEHAPDGKLQRIVRLCREPAPLGSASVAAMKQRMIDAESDAESRARMTQALAWLQTPRTGPAFTELLVDATGHMWAREFSPPGDASTWHVFNPAGRYVASVQSPSGVSLLEIGRDWVLAKSADADGVESVRVYGLSR